VPDHANIGEALLAFQKEAPAIQKNAINPHFKNSYISLERLTETVMPILHKHGLVVTQWPTHIATASGEVEPALRTSLIHAPSDQMQQDTMPLVLDKENPQGQGSAITYARRYALMSILGLVADEDDDGSAGSAKTRPKRGKKEAPAAAAESGDESNEAPPF
jgi:hypothetical protein